MTTSDATAVVLTGVAGVGKTTIGRRLATALGWEFHDADDFHSPANVAKMRAGVALDEADRAPWLARLRALIEEIGHRSGRAVLACSALRRAHRDRLRVPGIDVRFVHLSADPTVLRSRLAARRAHYMPATLLDSQLATLEPPNDAPAVDTAGDPDDVVDAIRRLLER